MTSARPRALPLLPASLALALLALAVLTAPPLSAFGKPEWELELDPYYSDVALTVPFSAETSTGSVEQTEMGTYRDMARQLLLPRFMLLEASVNPLPLGSAIFRNNEDSLYRRSQLTPSLNLIEAVMAGFEEPYALSLFLGNVVDFSAGRKTMGHRRKGYIGYLLSYGNYHIMESLLIPDDWVETEAKIKGDLVTDERKMSWSFRAGNKSHAHPEIADTFYFGVRRDRIDYRADFRQGDFKPVGHFVMVEKNFPFAASKRKLTFSLGLGYQWLSREKYAGSLAARRLRPESRIMIRPNLKF